MENKERVNVSCRADLVEATSELFDALGLTTETAIDIFLAACVRETGIPFPVGFGHMYHEHDFDCDCDDCDCGEDCNCEDCDCEDCDCDDCDCEDREDYED